MPQVKRKQLLVDPPSNVVYVDGATTLPEAEQTGSQDTPYKSLQDGIEAASSGATLYVAPGDYSEEGQLSIETEIAIVSIRPGSTVEAAVHVSSLVLIDSFEATADVTFVGVEWSGTGVSDSFLVLESCQGTVDSTSAIAASNCHLQVDGCSAFNGRNVDFGNGTILTCSGTAVTLYESSFGTSPVVVFSGSAGTLKLDGLTSALFDDIGGSVTNGTVEVLGGGDGGSSDPLSNVFFLDANTDVPSNDQTGSQEKPFSSLAAAWTASEPLIEGGADVTWLLCPGTYTGPFAPAPEAVTNTLTLKGLAAPIGLGPLEVGSAIVLPAVDGTSANGLGLAIENCVLSDEVDWTGSALTLSGCHYSDNALEAGSLVTRSTNFSGDSLVLGVDGALVEMYLTKFTGSPEIQFLNEAGILRLDNVTNYWWTETEGALTNGSKVVLEAGTAPNLPANPGDNNKLAYASNGNFAYLALGIANTVLAMNSDGTANAYRTIDSTMIEAGGIDFDRLDSIAGLSVLGRSANSSGVVAAITGTDGGVLHVSGTTLGFGTIGTSSITDDAITFAKIQDITSDRLLGRDTDSSGNVEQITVGGGLEFTGSGGIRRSALTGDVTAPAGSNTTTIANNAVTLGKLQTIATNSLLGRDTSGTGSVEVIGLNATLSMTGTGQLQRAALTGDITAPAGSNTTAIAAGVIVNADVNASAAINGTKISPDFGAQDVVTTGSYTGAYITLGDSGPFADWGLIRVPPGSDVVYGRNAADTFDKPILGWHNDTATLGGNVSDFNAAIQVDAASTISFLFGTTAQVTATNSLFTISPDLALGSTPASSGDLRVPHGFSWVARNNANNADNTLMTWGAVNDVQQLGSGTHRIDLLSNATSGGVRVSVSGVGTTSRLGLVLINETAATDGNQQNSPAVRWSANGWSVSAGATRQVDWVAQCRPIQTNASPRIDLVWSWRTQEVGTFNDYVTWRSDGFYAFYGVDTTSGIYLQQDSNNTNPAKIVGRKSSGSGGAAAVGSALVEFGAERSTGSNTFVDAGKIRYIWDYADPENSANPITWIETHLFDDVSVAAISRTGRLRVDVNSATPVQVMSFPIADGEQLDFQFDVTLVEGGINSRARRTWSATYLNDGGGSGDTIRWPDYDVETNPLIRAGDLATTDNLSIEVEPADSYVRLLITSYDDGGEDPDIPVPVTAYITVTVARIDLEP